MTAGPVRVVFDTNILVSALTVNFRVSKVEVDSIVERLRTRAELAQIEGKSGWVPNDPDAISSDIEILTARQFVDRLAATGSGVT